MRRLILPALLAAGSVSPAMAAERAFPIAGGYDRIANSTPFDVYVHTGKSPSVRASGTDKAVELLQIENRDGELRVGTRPGRWFSGWFNRERARIDVTLPTLAGASVSGPGNMNVDAVKTPAFRGRLSGPGNISISAIEAGTVVLNLSGPGNISIAGRGGRGELSVSGPGNIRAERLNLADATVNVSGPGDVITNVSRTANVRVSGPGNVRIRGGAHCSIHKSGPGSIDCG